MNLNNPQEFQKAMDELTPEVAIRAIDSVLMMQSFTRPEHAYFQKCLEVLRPAQQPVETKADA